jgi:hypothetical protein
MEGALREVSFGLVGSCSDNGNGRGKDEMKKSLLLSSVFVIVFSQNNLNRIARIPASTSSVDLELCVPAWNRITKMTRCELDSFDWIQKFNFNRNHVHATFLAVPDND